MIVAQGGKCAICAETFSKPEKLAPRVDHCHATGKVRGILCHHCNVLIGHAKESTSVLASAVRYITEYRQ